MYIRRQFYCHKGENRWLEKEKTFTNEKTDDGKQGLSNLTSPGKLYMALYMESSTAKQKKKRSEAMTNLKKSEKAVAASSQLDLHQVSSMWLDSLRSTRKASTIVCNQLGKHILPVFGDNSLSEISNEAMIAFGNNLLSGDNGLTSKSASEVISRMKSKSDIPFLKRMLRNTV